MRAGEDAGDDAGEDAEGDDGVVVVVLATSRDRREAHLDGLAADAHASEAEADANANGAGDDDENCGDEGDDDDDDDDDDDGGETTRGRDESDVGSDRRRGDGYSWRRGNESGCERAPPSADCSRARRSTRWSARLGRRRRVGDSFYEVNNDRCNVYRRVRRARFGCRRLAASRSRRRGRRLRNRRATSDEGEASSWALITKSADERSGDCDVAGAMRFACEIT